MVRLLLATTAVAAILSTAVYAQDASSSAAPDVSAMASSSASPADTSGASSSMAPAPADTSSSAMASSAMDSSAMSSQMSTASSMESSMMDDASSAMSSVPADTTTTVTPRAPVQILSGYTRVDTDQLASKIIGKPVFDSKAKDANNLGNINDLVLNTNGDVAAVVLGVGGFLGLGEKQVAVDYSALQWVIADDNTERFVLQTTKDELTNAPDFQTVDDQPTASSAQ